jgi:hypothetical protein
MHGWGDYLWSYSNPKGRSREEEVLERGGVKKGKSQEGEESGRGDVK